MIARPVGASSPAMVPRKPVAMSSSKAYRSEDVSTMPMALVVPRARLRAAGSGPAYPSFLAASRMVCRMAAESWSGREKAFETVILLTPTWSAIVWRVTRATPSG